MEVTDEFRENMRLWIKNNRQGKYGRAPYSAEDYGLTKDGLLEHYRPYVEQFCPDLL